MKTNLSLVLGVLSFLFCELTFAQQTAGTVKTFRPYIALNTDPSSLKPFNAVMLSDGIYGTGSITGIETNVPPNGALVGLNGIIYLSINGTQPAQVAGGIPFASGYGVDGIAETPGKLWAIVDSPNGSKLYTCDATDKSAWVAKNLVTDNVVKFMQTIDDSTLLFVGLMNVVNGIQVNGICTYNTETEAVCAVGNGFASPYHDPIHISLSSDKMKICIADRTGLSIYNKATRTFTEISGPGLANNYGFLISGNTMYATGPDNNGSALYRKIGNNNWELLGYVNMGLGGTIVRINDYIVLLTASGCDHITTGTGSVINGTEFAFNETTSQFVNSPITNFNGIRDFLVLPNGEYLGWSAGAGIFTTASLVSGVTEVSDNSNLHIYPNPAHSFVVIDGLIEGQDILITNNLGQTVLRTTATENRFVLDTKNFAPGIFFVNQKYKVFIN